MGTVCCLEQLSNWFLRLALDQFVGDLIQWLNESPSPLD